MVPGSCSLPRGSAHEEGAQNLFFVRFFSMIDYYKKLSVIPCAMQYLLFLLYMVMSTCSSQTPNLYPHPMHSPLVIISFFSTDHQKSKKVPENIYLSFIDYAKAFDCVDHDKLWKILKEMGIPEHLTCRLRNLYASQEATVRTGHGTTDCFQIGKGARQGCILSYMQSTS